MEMQQIEFVMSTVMREQLLAILAEVPTKFGIPLLNIVNAMEQRSSPKKDADE